MPPDYFQHPMFAGYNHPAGGNTRGNPLQPSFPMSPYAAMGGPGQIYAPMATWAPPSVGPPIPGLSGVGGQIANGLLTMLAGSATSGNPVGGLGFYNPAELLAQSRYNNELNMAMGYKGPAGQAPLINPEEVDTYARYLNNVGVAMTGGKRGMLRADLSRFDELNKTGLFGAFNQASEAMKTELENNVSALTTMRAEGGATAGQTSVDIAVLRKGEKLRQQALMDEYRGEVAELPEIETAKFKIQKDSQQMADVLAGLGAGPGGKYLTAALDALATSPMIGEALNPIFGPKFLARRAHRAMQSLPGMSGGLLFGPPGAVTQQVVRSIQEEFNLDMTADGIPVTSPNMAFTRGFTMANMGEMMLSMGRRGILGSGLGQRSMTELYTESIAEQRMAADREGREFDPIAARQIAGQTATGRARIIKERIGKMTEVMDEMGEIFGRGKSMEELFQKLDAMTGGALQQMSLNDVKRVAQQTREISLITGVSAEIVSNTMAAAAISARQQGLPGPVGVNAAQQAMLTANAILGYRQEGAGNEYFGRQNFGELTSGLTGMAMRGATSRLSKVGGGLLSLVGERGDIAGAQGESASAKLRWMIRNNRVQDVTQAQKTLGLVTRMENGTLTGDDLEKLQGGGYSELRSMTAQAFGMSSDMVTEAFETQTHRTRKAWERTGQGADAMLAAQGTEMLRLTGDFTRRRVGRILGGMGVDAGRAQDVSRGIVAGFRSARGTSAEDLRESVQQSLGRTGIRATDTQAADFVRAFEAGALRRTGMELPQLVELTSNRTRRLRELDQLRVGRVMEMDVALRKKGIGRQTVVGRVIDDILSPGDKDETIQETFQRIAGEIPSEKLSEALGDLQKGWLKKEKIIRTAIDKRRKELVEGVDAGTFSAEEIKGKKRDLVTLEKALVKAEVERKNITPDMASAFVEAEKKDLKNQEYRKRSEKDIIIDIRKDVARIAEAFEDKGKKSEKVDIQEDGTEATITVTGKLEQEGSVTMHRAGDNSEEGEMVTERVDAYLGDSTGSMNAL